MTPDEARTRAERLFLKLMHEVSFGRGVDAPITMIADELLAVAAEMRAAGRSIARGPDYALSLCMITTPGYEGWANLILDSDRFQRGLIAMLPPPLAEVLREHIPLLPPRAAPAPGPR